MNDFRNFPYYPSPRFLDRSTLYTSAAVQIDRENTPPTHNCANENYFRFVIHHLGNGQRATRRSRNSQPFRNRSTNNRDMNDFRNFPYYRSPPVFRPIHVVGVCGSPNQPRKHAADTKWCKQKLLPVWVRHLGNRRGATRRSRNSQPLRNRPINNGENPLLLQETNSASRLRLE